VATNGQDRSARRRAGTYRQRAEQLAKTAACDPQYDRRQHMLDLAATCQRAADAIAPSLPAEPSAQMSRRPAPCRRSAAFMTMDLHRS